MPIAPEVFREELAEAKRILAVREHETQAKLRDAYAELRDTGDTTDAWTVGHAYTELLGDMAIDGTELVEWAERLVDEFIELAGRTPSAREMRALVLSSASLISTLWYLRSRADG